MKIYACLFQTAKQLELVHELLPVCCHWATCILPIGIFKRCLFSKEILNPKEMMPPFLLKSTGRLLNRTLESQYVSLLHGVLQCP